MNIEEERKAFEALYKPCDRIAFCFGLKKYVQLSREDNDSEIVDHANQCWELWQAAKAQAVPEGYVLVKKVHPDAIVHNQGLSLFKECQVIYGWNGKSKDFKNALNRGFYHGVKLGAKAVLGSEIEAQEQSNV